MNRSWTVLALATATRGTTGAACSLRQALWRQVVEQYRWRPCGKKDWRHRAQAIVAWSSRTGFMPSPSKRHGAYSLGDCEDLFLAGNSFL
jgi:predicted ArsR family transcriptional regulator